MSRLGCLLNLYMHRPKTLCPLNNSCYECYTVIKDRLEFPPAETDRNPEFELWLEQKWKHYDCDRNTLFA